MSNLTGFGRPTDVKFKTLWCKNRQIMDCDGNMRIPGNTRLFGETTAKNGFTKTDLIIQGDLYVSGNIWGGNTGGDSIVANATLGNLNCGLLEGIGTMSTCNNRINMVSDGQLQFEPVTSGSIVLGSSETRTRNGGANTILIGHNIDSRSSESIAVGSEITAYGGISVGLESYIGEQEYHSIAIGSGNTNYTGARVYNGDSCIAIGGGGTGGNGARAYGSTGSIAIGSASSTRAGPYCYDDDMVILSNASNTDGLYSYYSFITAIGTNLVVQGQSTVCIGRACRTEYSGAIAIGGQKDESSTRATDPYGIAIGTIARSLGRSTIAIGTSAVGQYNSDYSICIGGGSTCGNDYGIAIGYSSGTGGTFGTIAIGYNAYASIGGARLALPALPLNNAVYTYDRYLPVRFGATVYKLLLRSI